MGFVEVRVKQGVGERGVGAGSRAGTGVKLGGRAAGSPEAPGRPASTHTTELWHLVTDLLY